MLYFFDKQFSQHISILKYLIGYDNQNILELDQALISANQTINLINLLPQLIKIFDH